MVKNYLRTARSDVADSASMFIPNTKVEYSKDILHACVCVLCICMNVHCEFSYILEKG